MEDAGDRNLIINYIPGTVRVCCCCCERAGRRL